MKKRLIQLFHAFSDDHLDIEERKNYTGLADTEFGAFSMAISPVISSYP
jgi:hypothetical protein